MSRPKKTEGKLGVIITFATTKEQADQMDAAAQSTKTDRSKLIRAAIEQYINQKTKYQ